MTQNKKIYTQFDIDRMFNYMLNGQELEFTDDCERIKTLIKAQRNITLSAPATVKFWITRSGWWDASWLAPLTGPQGDDDILTNWDDFVDTWHIDEDD